VVQRRALSVICNVICYACVSVIMIPTISGMLCTVAVTVIIITKVCWWSWALLCLVLGLKAVVSFLETCQCQGCGAGAKAICNGWSRSKILGKSCSFQWKKKSFWFGGADFFEWCHKRKAFRPPWPTAPGPGHKLLDGGISLKILLETRLQSKSFDTLDDLLGFLDQKLWYKVIKTFDELGN